jgi:hypothetical protein
VRARSITPCWRQVDAAHQGGARPHLPVQSNIQPPYTQAGAAGLKAVECPSLLAAHMQHTYARHTCKTRMQDQHARDETGSAREGLGATYLQAPLRSTNQAEHPLSCSWLPHTKQTTLTHATLEPMPDDERPGGPLQIRKVCCRANWQSKDTTAQHYMPLAPCSGVAVPWCNRVQ